MFRLHQKQIVDSLRVVARPSGPETDSQGDAAEPVDSGVRADGSGGRVFQAESLPAWTNAAEYVRLPESITVREVRYRIETPGFRTHEVTLVTTLVDEEVYPAAAFAELYAMRWRVEEHLKSLKQTMKMDVLKCTTVDGVLKEMTMYAIAYNLVRLTMCRAGASQKVAPDRISFIDALRWLRDSKDGDEMPELVVNPARPNRYEPRVRKRRPKPYPLMKRPRAELRKLLRELDLAA